MGPLVMGLQNKLRQLQMEALHVAALMDRPEDLAALELRERIGSGGFGTVYRGCYRGAEVAVKLVLERQGDKEALRDAVELAVISTLSHPNILQVLTYFTDVVVGSGAAAVPTSPAAAIPEDRQAIMAAAGVPLVQGPPRGGPDVRLLPSSTPPDDQQPGAEQLPHALAICMEFCDRGSLVDGIQQVRVARRGRRAGGLGGGRPCRAGRTRWRPGCWSLAAG
jgi:serine/threonine protein kinase